MSFSVLNEQKTKGICDHSEVHLTFDIAPALIEKASVVKNNRKRIQCASKKPIQYYITLEMVLLLG